MKLLHEQLDAKVIVESTDSGDRKYYIEGIFIQSDIVNRNNRIYPSKVVDNQIKHFTENYINKNRAVGELSHGPTIEINPDRISHKIISLVKEGSNWVGKAKIIDTPTGKIVKNLIDEGIQLGVSSKALGSVVVNEGVSVVQEDFELRTVDIVYDPSAPDAFVTAIMENKEWIYKDGILVEKEVELIKNEVNTISKLNKLNEKSLNSLFKNILAKY
jgi:hypothetical protein